MENLSRRQVLIKCSYGSAWSSANADEPLAIGETIICDADDPNFMMKVNKAVGREIYSAEQIREHASKLAAESLP